MHCAEVFLGHRSLGGGPWNIRRDCLVQWSARAAGNWRSRLATPHPTVCRTCNKNYRWDEDLAHHDLKTYAVEHLADSDGVLVVEEAGFSMKGTNSVGAQGLYSGTAGRIESCQIGVFLACVERQG